MSPRHRTLLCSMLFLPILTSCTLFRGKVANAINKAWPPVDIETQRGTAIQSAANALTYITAPNVAFGSRLDALRRVVASKDLENAGVTSVRLWGDRQLIFIETDVHKTFEGPASPTTPGERLLASLKPEVRATLRFYAGVTSGSTANTDDTLIDLKILPGLQNVTVHRVKVKEHYDVTALAQAIEAAVNEYSANISGVLSQHPVMQVHVPTTIEDVEHAVHFSEGMTDITMNPNPIQAPVSLYGISWLVTPTEVRGLAQTTPVQNIPTSTYDGPYDDLHRTFLAASRRAFGKDVSYEGPWVAIRKDLLADITNSVVQQAKFCISSNGALPYEKLKDQVRFPDESSVNCTPTRDCTPTRACNFPPQRDTRSCSRCVLWRPGWPFGDGGCAQEANDPFCEAAKAAQNLLYDLDAGAKKADCERLKTQEKLICEAEKAGEKALCETGKELLKRLARTGKFANLEIGVSATTNDLKVCIEQMRLAPSLDDMDLKLKVSGGASADLDIKFVPLDIIGHLTCAIPWTDSQTFHATLRKDLIESRPSIRFITNENDAKVKFSIPEGKLSLHLQPGPTEFIMTSVNMTIACQGLNLLKPLLLDLTPFIPALRGAIDYKYKAREVLVDLPLPRQKIGDRTLAAKLDQTDEALFLHSGWK